MNKEMFKIIPGFSRYLVSSLGTIYCKTYYGKPLDKPKPIPPHQKGPYLQVNLTDDKGLRRPFTIHILVLTAFKGPKPKGLEGCHNDGNSRNNQIDNLRWDTRENNIKDRAKHGTNPVGIKNPNSTLTDQIVLQIVKDWNNGASYKVLKEKYKVAENTIRGVIANNSWRHVKRTSVKKEPNSRGEANNNHKLTIENVLEIRSLLKTDMKRKQIADKFGVFITVIEKIKSGALWSHVK